jgi:hypothetical protein
MAVKGSDATTVAQEHQIPPALRNWARTYCADVRAFKRYNSHNESNSCGYVVEANSATTRRLPDQFELRHIGTSICTDEPGVRMNIRDA